MTGDWEATGEVESGDGSGNEGENRGEGERGLFGLLGRPLG